MGRDTRMYNEKNILEIPLRLSFIPYLLNSNYLWTVARCNLIFQREKFFTIFPKYWQVSQFKIKRGGLNKRMAPTDNLNINKRRVQIKEGGGLKKVLSKKWQPFITNYGCPKQNFFALSRYSWYWRDIKVILLSHSQGIFKYMYLFYMYSLYIILTSNVKINGICMKHFKYNVRMI